MDKGMMLEATDIIRTVSTRQRGFKRLVGQLINKIYYIYYKLM